MAKPKERHVQQAIARTAFTRTVTQIEQTCPVCHREFWGATIRKYCTRACRQKANYHRHAEAYRAARMESYRKQKAGQAP